MSNRKIDLSLFIICFVTLFVFITGANAQNSISPVKLQLNDLKYLFVKFPSDVKYADMGSAEISAEKVKDNIIKLKATEPAFEKTNLSVVTTDGKYHSFELEYSPMPDYIAVDMENLKERVNDKDIIPATRIEVSDLNTSHFIFPSKVADISLGSEFVISEKADQIDNLVKVKSTAETANDFMQTSITVVTENGTIYPMIADFNKYPEKMSITFDTQKSNAMFQGVNVNDNEMESMAKWIIDQGLKIVDVGINDFKMTFQLCSIFTDQDIIAFHLQMINDSRIDYGIDFVKAYIQDKKISKMTAMQEDEIVPIYVYYSDKDKTIHGKEKYHMVLFYKKFTIPEKRCLYFEMFEQNGGRHTKFSASQKNIIKAEVIEKK